MPNAPTAKSLVFLEVAGRIHVRVPGEIETPCHLILANDPNRIEDFDADWCQVCQEVYRNRPLVTAE